MSSDKALPSNTIKPKPKKSVTFQHIQKQPPVATVKQQPIKKVPQPIQKTIVSPDVKAPSSAVKTSPALPNHASTPQDDVHTPEDLNTAKENEMFLNMDDDKDQHVSSQSHLNMSSTHAGELLDIVFGITGKNLEASSMRVGASLTCRANSSVE
jgi:hypothetical protein